ncbi:histidinol dehydrogenase [Natronincola ferrireducens]|uniref:Histidinol dehydrogenase n=1 Tax=Natronincola ferrireducens TaxID=393762 RepID=A0A1G8X4K4_9FIRM|nr:histidinol dehydrogenase [Natronincola ferrireducens]SDJ85287.1 histidinol dehydrogenase [Natronincola ferrireducens]
MMDIIKLQGKENQSFFKELKKRTTVDFKDYEKPVEEILEAVKTQGDAGLLEYTQRFDGIDLKERGLRVREEEFDEAYNLVEEDFIQALRRAIDNIRSYHERQRQNSWFTTSEGIFLGQKVTPIARVGIYVPGGTAAYPSSVLMNTIPAQVAGVKGIVMVTPPDREGKVSPGVLVAAKELGVKEVYRVGGAQAVAALAFGTESIKRVDKIVGPGNIYVATAKRAVYGYVDIDMIAGPSEVLVIADETANPKFVAADLLSQAEHDEMASALLITTSEKLGMEVREELIRQTQQLERRDIIEKSLRNYGKIMVVEDLKIGVALANEIAPEHLELCVEKPFELLDAVENAGAIFLGHYTPEPLGDYFAGPNHVLPTSGTAKFYSPLSVEDFIKKSSVIYYSQEALRQVKEDVMTLAAEEGLTAHKNSIKVRYEDDDK